MGNNRLSHRNVTEDLPNHKAGVLNQLRVEHVPLQEDLHRINNTLKVAGKQAMRRSLRDCYVSLPMIR